MTQIGFDPKALGVTSRYMKRADVRSASACHVVKFVMLPQAAINPIAEEITLAHVQGQPELSETALTKDVDAR